MDKKIFSLLIIIIALGMAMQGYAAQKQSPKKSVPKEQPKNGGALVFSMGKEFANPNPFFETSSASQFVKEATYESLLTTNDDDKIVPNLAERYVISSDGTSYTFNLRRGVKFHNGKEMNADDVIWSANHARNPKNTATGLDYMNSVKAIEKIDDYTVRFNLFKPSVTFLSYLSDIQMLPIVPANSMQIGQIKLEKNAFVPGTGPFIFEQYQPGFDTVLKKFPDYWGGPAYLDKIIFRPVANDSNRFNALRTGDVMMADRLSALDVMRVKKGEIKGIKILEEPLGGYKRLVFNYENPLLQKMDIRRAILYSMDKQRIVDEVYFGMAIKAELKIDPNSIWAKAAGLPAHKRDLAKAKALLKAAGYTGQEFVLIGRKQDSPAFESMQRMLGEAGIRVKLDILEAGVMKERFAAGKYDFYVAGGSDYSDPVISMNEGYLTSRVEKGRYSSPKVDKLLEELGAEFDTKKRLIIFKDLARTVHNDVADIPILFEIRYVGMLDRVRDYGPPLGASYSESGKYFKNVWLQ